MEGCAPAGEVARKSQTRILRALASVGQRPVADALGKSETWVSRWKSEDVETFARLLEALGLKVVPIGVKCYEPEYVEHLRYFARLGFNTETPALNVDEGDAE
jgi:hypothetical protein